VEAGFGFTFGGGSNGGDAEISLVALRPMEAVPAVGNSGVFGAAGGSGGEVPPTEMEVVTPSLPSVALGVNGITAFA
jgi:hypothetical protein